MAAPVCQFVDRVGTGAVQRLNLNDGYNFKLMQGPDVRPGPDFSPPALKRAVVNTLLAEGASIPASAYDNRIIRLPIMLTACSEDEMAEKMESLHRELDRSNNVLEWHPTYNFRPVYFRTFRSPDYKLNQTMEGRGEYTVTLALVAEPFAYGNRVEQTGTVDNDPEAGVNPISFQITGAEGDVPTPLFLHYLAFTNPANVLAVRRHGTPVLYFEQAEAMAQGADTALQPNDALMSGAGQNYSRTTFAGFPAMNNRLGWNPCPAAGSNTDYRGEYRFFVRVRRSDNTSDINIQVAMASGGSAIYLPLTTVPKTVNIQMVDCGLMSIPMANDPVYDGYSRVILPTAGVTLEIGAERLAGAGTIDWDYAVLVPADEELAIGSFVPSVDNAVYDGPNDLVYHGNLTIVHNTPATIVGSIPLVTPDQTNLYVVLNGIATNTLADTLDYTARYWPRYLYVR